MKTIFLAKEVLFWSQMAKSIGKPDAEKLWKEHGSIAEYLNKQIKMLITDISAGKVSIAMFTVENAVMLRSLLDHPEINPQLVEQLEQILYGGDERKRFFNEESGSHLSKLISSLLVSFLISKNLLFFLFSNIIISSYYKTKSSALANKHLTSKNKNKKSHTTKQTTSSREKASLGSLDS